MNYRHTEADMVRLGHVRKLFDAFERGVSDTRAARYVEALRGVDTEKLGESVEFFIRTWERVSPPSIGKLRDHALGTTAADRDAEDQELKVLRYYLERYSDPDQHVFRHAFGYVPTRSTFERMDVPVPAGVEFIELHFDYCAQERARARDLAREAFRRAQDGVLGQGSVREDDDAKDDWWVV